MMIGEVVEMIIPTGLMTEMRDIKDSDRVENDTMYQVHQSEKC